MQKKVIVVNASARKGWNTDTMKSFQKNVKGQKNLGVN